MEIGDIQALFGYIKGLLPDCKSIPRLTKNTARSWCDAFEGYTLEQLKQAAAENAGRKPFWPNIRELMEYLPALDVERARATVWPNNGYASPEDYVRQLRALSEMGRLMESDYEAAGIPHPARARGMGWSVAQWNEACRRAAEERSLEHEKTAAV